MGWKEARPLDGRVDVTYWWRLEMLGGASQWRGACGWQAAWYGYRKIVTELLKAGTDPRLVNHMGESAVQAARLAGKDDIVQMLLKGEAEFDAVRGVDVTCAL